MSDSTETSGTIDDLLKQVAALKEEVDDLKSGRIITKATKIAFASQLMEVAELRHGNNWSLIVVDKLVKHVNNSPEVDDLTKKDALTKEQADLQRESVTAEPDDPYCTECGCDDLNYLATYANGDEWECKGCKKTFMW